MAGTWTSTLCLQCQAGHGHELFQGRVIWTPVILLLPPPASWEVREASLSSSLSTPVNHPRGLLAASLTLGSVRDFVSREYSRQWFSRRLTKSYAFHPWGWAHALACIPKYRAPSLPHTHIWIKQNKEKTMSYGRVLIFYQTYHSIHETLYVFPFYLGIFLNHHFALVSIDLLLFLLLFSQLKVSCILNCNFHGFIASQ